MEQIPSWKANSHSASQEIPHLLWDLKVHYHVHEGLLAVDKLWFCPAFWWWVTTICLVFPVFTSRPTSPLASNRDHLCFSLWYLCFHLIH
jgi:hypothetical protein